MGKSLGDKVVMSSHLLLLAVVAVASASFPELAIVGVCSRHRLNFEFRHCFAEKLEGDGGEEAAATCCTGGVVRNGRSRQLGRGRARRPRFARRREQRRSSDLNCLARSEWSRPPDSAVCHELRHLCEQI